MSGYRVQYGSSAYPYPEQHSQQQQSNGPDPSVPSIRLASSAEGGPSSGGSSHDVHAGKGGDERWNAPPRHVDYTARPPYWSSAPIDEGPQQYRLPISSSLGLSLAPISTHPNRHYSPYPRGGPYNYYPPSTASPPIMPRLKSDYSDPPTFTGLPLPSSSSNISRAPYSSTAVLSPIQALAALSETYDSHSPHHNHPSNSPQYPVPSSHYLASRPEQWNTLVNGSTSSYAEGNAPAPWAWSPGPNMHYPENGSGPSGSGPGEPRSRTESYGHADDVGSRSSADSVQKAEASGSGSKKMGRGGKDGKPGIVKKWACDLCTGAEKRSFARPSALKIHQVSLTSFSLF